MSCPCAIVTGNNDCWSPVPVVKRNFKNDSLPLNRTPGHQRVTACSHSREQWLRPDQKLRILVLQLAFISNCYDSIRSGLMQRICRCVSFKSACDAAIHRTWNSPLVSHISVHDRSFWMANLTFTWINAKVNNWWGLSLLVRTLKCLQ